MFNKITSKDQKHYHIKTILSMYVTIRMFLLVLF